MKRTSFICSVLFIGILGTGCGGTDGQSTSGAIQITPITPPPIEVPVPPIEPLTKDGQPFEGSDSCLKLGDDVVEALGFDPLSRERGASPPAQSVFVGCSFSKAALPQRSGPPNPIEKYLHVRATELALSELEESAEEHEEVEINNRSGMRFTELGINFKCSIAVERSYGSLLVAKAVMRDYTSELPCDHLEDITEVIDSAVSE